MTLGSVLNDSGLNRYMLTAWNSGALSDIEKRYHIRQLIASPVNLIISNFSRVSIWGIKRTS
jgi:hypothetical protein